MRAGIVKGKALNCPFFSLHFSLGTQRKVEFELPGSRQENKGPPGPLYGVIIAISI